MGVIYWLRSRSTGRTFDLDKRGFLLLVDDDPDGMSGVSDERLDPAITSDDLDVSTERMLRYARDRSPGLQFDNEYRQYVLEQWQRWRNQNPGPLEIQNDAGEDDHGEFTGGICTGTEYDHR